MLTLDEQIARLADHAEASATAAAADGPDGANRGAIELRGTVTDLDAHRRRRRRRWTLAVAAAVVLAGAAGVTLAPRWIEPDEPVATVPEVTEPTTAPPTTTGPSAPTVVPVVPDAVGGRPSRFPALPVSDPRDAGATAVAGFRTTGSITQLVATSAALVGRVVDDELVESVLVQVLESPLPPSEEAAYRIDPVTIDGRTYDAWRARGGNPVMTTLVDREDPRVQVIGADPAAFLDVLGGAPASGITTDGGAVQWDLAPVPSDWTVIVAPRPAPARSLLAQLTVPRAAGGESEVVGVSMIPELFNMVGGGTLRRVDIHGTEGWLDVDVASAVYWSPDDGEYAFATSPASGEAALDLARSVEFVDEATWRERYDVSADDMPLP